MEMQQQYFLKTNQQFNEASMNEAVNNNGKKIFVTGASGLVGSHLIPALLGKGYEITALYRKQVPQIVSSDSPICGQTN